MNHSLYILDDSPHFEWIELTETDSTNNFLKNYRPVRSKELTLVSADYQSQGRGQIGNRWEAEAGKNLLFSLGMHPVNVDARQQFVLSQAIALSVCKALGEHTSGLSIKWPNDIYWRDRKICGILIENTLTGHAIETSIAGVGVNVNQSEFRSDTPNPVSLKQITGKETERVFILARIVELFTGYYGHIRNGDFGMIAEEYGRLLYRRTGFHPYEDADGHFEAELHGVEPTGHLLLKDRSGRLRRYAFKEVRFLIPGCDLSPTNDINQQL